MSRGDSGHAAPGAAREQVEIERITQALQRYGNNRLRAAAALGISRRTLYKKLHRYSLGAIKAQE